MAAAACVLPLAVALLPVQGRRHVVRAAALVPFAPRLAGAEAETAEASGSVGDVDPSVREPPITDRCFLDMSVDGVAVGRITIGLYGTVAPRTCENFKALADGTAEGRCYAGSRVYRVIEGLTVQMGDVVRNDGTSGASASGPSIPRENFRVRHTLPGMVSMVNGPAGVDSRFLITTRPGGSEYLDGKFVGFGRVVEGMDVVQRIDHLPTVGTKNAPRSNVVIDKSGAFPA